MWWWLQKGLPHLKSWQGTEADGCWQKSNTPLLDREQSFRPQRWRDCLHSGMTPTIFGWVPVLTALKGNILTGWHNCPKTIVTVEPQRRFVGALGFRLSLFDLKLQADGKVGAAPHRKLNGQLPWMSATLGGGEGWGCSISNLAVKSKYMSTLKIKSPLKECLSSTQPRSFFRLAADVALGTWDNIPGGQCLEGKWHLWAVINIL